jgi:hypothetical protein
MIARPVFRRWWLLTLAACLGGCAAPGIQEVPTPAAPSEMPVMADSVGSQEEALPTVENTEPAATPSPDADEVTFEQPVELDDIQEQSPEGGPDIGYGIEYSAEFFDNSVLSVTFDGVLGDALRVDVIGPGPQLDVDIYLYSPYQQVLAYAVGASRGEAETLAEIQLPYTGRYRLELRPTGSGRASFIVEQLSQNELTGGGIFTGEGRVLSGRFEGPGVFHSYQFDADEGDTVRLSATAQAFVDELEFAVVVLGPDGAQFAYADAAVGVAPADLVLGEWQLTRTGTYSIVVYSLNGVPGVYQLGLERVQSLRP